MIDSASILEDHLRTVELFTQVGSTFDTMHGLLIFAAGKRQQVYRIKDVTPLISPPIEIIFSASLMMIISVHSKDVIFRHAVTGDELMHKSLMHSSSEYTTAITDIRCKKLICGDTKGALDVYNCLSGVQLRMISASNAPIVQLIYTPDKNIIVLDGKGDIILVDDNPRDADSNTILRVFEKPHEAEIKTIAYSHTLGLIVSVDCTGTLLVFDYEFLVLLLSIKNVSDTEISQMLFLEDYPLLLLKDLESFIIISFTCNDSPVSFDKIWRIKMNPIVIDDSKVDDEGCGKVLGKATYYTSRQLARFLRYPKDVRCMKLRFSVDSNAGKCLDNESSSLTSSQEIDGAETSSCLPEDSAKDESDFENTVGYGSTLQRLWVYCGSEDGALFVFDLSQSLADTESTPVPKALMAMNRLGYNAKRLGRRVMGATEFQKKLVSEDHLDICSFNTSADLLCAWDAHRQSISGMHIVGHRDDLLTCSDDRAIYLHTSEGVFKGVLTYGQEIDKYIKPKWHSPIDMEVRERVRLKEAAKFIDELHLRPTDPKILKRARDGLITDEVPASSLHALKHTIHELGKG